MRNTIFAERESVAETALTVVLEKTPSNWCAYTPDDIGVVVATGQTRDAEEGLPTPNVRELKIRETTPV